MSYFKNNNNKKGLSFRGHRCTIANISIIYSCGKYINNIIKT